MKGAKARREATALRLFRDEVRARTWCEVTRLVTTRDARELVCGTDRMHGGIDPHHLWPEDRDLGLHDPARALLLCRRAHNWTHSHPADARVLGLLRPEEQ